MKTERHIEGQAVPPVVMLLMRARERVEKDWWKPGSGPSGGSAVCPIMALYRDEDIDIASGRAVRFLRGALPFPWTSPIALNDYPTTTKADILALYDRAISNAIGESR